jgi:hypothetical protein
VAHGTNPLVDDAAADPDDDGLTNLQEYEWGTLPLNPDTDDDGLQDGAELVHGTNPLIADTDSDGLPDGWEVTYDFDPLSDGGLTQGLVARWTFDDGVGDVLANVVSTQWPGVAYGMGSNNWTVGRNRGALMFDGINDYVAVVQSNAGAVVTGAPFTVTAVIWQDPAGTGAFPTVVSDGTYSNGFWPGFTLRYQRTSDGLMLNIGSSNATMAQLVRTNWSAEMVGRWVDVALSHDGTTARLFVDGREVAAAARPFSAQMQPELLIGGGHVNIPDAFWQGKIDDVRIYRSALGTNELALVNDWISDADGDGVSNGEEYLAGTDPLNP